MTTQTLVRADAALVVGGPSVLATWGHTLVREAAALLPAPPAFCPLDRNDAIEPVPAAGTLARLHLCSFPGAALIEEVAGGRLPTVAFIDDPLDSVRYVRLHGGGSLLEALRVLTAALVMAPALAANPAVLVVRRDPLAEAVPVIEAVLTQLGIDLPEPALAALLEAQTAGGSLHLLEEVLASRIEGYLPPAALAEAMPAAEAALAKQILAPFVQAAVSGQPGRVTWPIEVFLSGDAPGEPAPRVVEVTGGARILTYGPYMHLPAGSWLVSFTIGFSSGLEDVPFRVQVHAGGLLAEARFLPPGHGVFAGSFVARHSRPQDSIEVLLCTDRGALEGRATLLGVTLEPAEGGA